MDVWKRYFNFTGSNGNSPTLSTRTNTEKNKIIIDSITNSYDLYSLSKSFLEQFDIDKKSIFYNILNEAIHENHTERIKNDDAIRKIRQLLKLPLLPVVHWRRMDRRD